jgi:hypothetical protein
MRRRALSAFLLGIGLWSAAALTSAETDSAVTRTSRPVRLLRSWEETVKQKNGTEYPRRVDVVFDYDSGVAFEKFYRLTGELLGSREIAHGLPAPSPEEIAEAFELARRAPELALIFERFKNVVFEGGFVLEEEKGRPCGPGARCLHVFLLSSDRSGLIRRVVVDLAREKLAYRVYTPEMGRNGQ